MGNESTHYTAMHVHVQGYMQSCRVVPSYTASENCENYPNMVGPFSNLKREGGLFVHIICLKTELEN